MARRQAAVRLKCVRRLPYFNFTEFLVYWLVLYSNFVKLTLIHARNSGNLCRKINSFFDWFLEISTYLLRRNKIDIFFEYQVFRGQLQKPSHFICLRFFLEHFFTMPAPIFSRLLMDHLSWLYSFHTGVPFAFYNPVNLLCWNGVTTKHILKKLRWFNFVDFSFVGLWDLLLLLL